jgi:hypothetical protein
MKNVKTALLAGAFAVATTTAFAQGTAPTSGSAGAGANVGANPNNLSGTADTKTKAHVGGVKTGADTNAKVKSQTTGSGAASGNAKGMIDSK